MATAPSTGSEAVFLAGIARARGHGREGVFVGWSELHAGEEKPECRTHGASFALELPDGHTVAIEALEREIPNRVVPARTERGDWSELEATPMARLVESLAPGPMVRVKLRGAIVRDGDPVFVIGRAIESSFDVQHGGPRSAATARASTVRPEVIGVGPDAESQARKKHLEIYPRPKAPEPEREHGVAIERPWESIAWLCVAALFIGVLLVSADSPSAPAWAASALLAVANAVWWRPSHLRAPQFVSMRATRLAGSASMRRGLSIGVTVVAGFVCAVTHALRTSIRPSEQQLGVLIATAVFPLACFVLVLIAWLAGRRDARAIGALLAEPEAERASRGVVWTTLAGTVKDSTPIPAIDGTPAAMTRQTAGDDDVKQETKGAFIVALADGTSVEIDPAGATWATSISARREQRDKDGTVQSVVEQDVVPVGAAVAVAGRLDRSARTMRAAGPESLIVFASAADSDPREVLRGIRSRRLDTIVLVSLVGTCAAALAIAVATRTHIPLFNPEPVARVVRYARSEIPASSFEDVCALPDHITVSPSVDDRTVALASLVLPFPVRLYGSLVQPPFSVSTNGWLSLSSTTDSGLSGHLPSTSRPNAVIAPYWADLKTRAFGICYAVVGAAPDRRLVVQWQDAYDCCSDNPSMHLTFEVVIHEAPARSSNVIDFVYAQLDGGHRAAVVGLEDANGLEGDTFSGTVNGPRGIRWEPE